MAGKGPENAILEEEYVAWLLKVPRSYYGPFLGYLGYASAQISNKEKNIQAIVTYCCVQRGLSQGGMDILSKFGFTLCKSTYTRYRDKKMLEYDSDVQYKQLNSHQCSNWIDNYNKHKHRNMPDVEDGIYVRANFSGVALLFGSPENNLSVIYDEQNELVTAWPTCLASIDAIEAVKVQFQVVTSDSRGFWKRYYETSYCRQANITLMPMKTHAQEVYFFFFIYFSEFYP